MALRTKKNTFRNLKKTKLLKNIAGLTALLVALALHRHHPEGRNL